jgi:alginate O-acetyltransferase complex protein AlgI
MVFSSLTFIFLFLPVTLAIYGLSPLRWRNGILLLASCLFYSWGAPKFLFILLASSALDYFLAHRIHTSTAATEKRWLITLGISVNAALLLYFKYANFFIDQVNALADLTGNTPLQWTRIALPIGISFFTFQKISYLVDVYKGTANPARSLLSYTLYVALFPQLIAGPIIRYHDVARQLMERDHTAEKMFAGLCRFCLGLGKKILIANTLGEVADTVFGLPLADLPTTTAWLGAVCYSFQIYFDFSGYSDMAIGLGRMFGFEYLENFNQPYLARSFTEFWRRWHISLSNWMREYLYIPLGGNRKGEIRTFINLWIVFLLSGFWHGASWTFVAWGAFHGFFLSLDKLMLRWKKRSLSAPLAMLITFILLNVSWVLFRSETLSGAWLFLQQMFTLSAPAETPGMGLNSLLTMRQTVALLTAVCISILPIPRPLAALSAGNWQELTRIQCFAVGLLSLLVFIISVSMLSTSTFNPFIYFRF